MGGERTAMLVDTSNGYRPKFTAIFGGSSALDFPHARQHRCVPTGITLAVKCLRAADDEPSTDDSVNPT